MNDWLWPVGMVLMGYVGFVLGVQYTFGRTRLHPFLWGLTHMMGPPPPWWSTMHRERYFHEHGVPWEIDEEGS